MRKPKLSIIIAVWNGESYIKRLCASLDQVCNNPFFEIVLIDDGSTDRTPAYLLELKEQSSNVKILRIDNCGQGKARNLGFKLSVGEYVYFADADDTLSSNFSKTIREHLEKYNDDVFIFGFKKVLDSQHRENIGIFPFPFLESKSIPPQELKTLYHLGHSSWNKIFKRSLLEESKLNFLEGQIYEDMAVVPCWVSLATTIRTSPLVIYEYTVRSGSSINTTADRSKDAIVALRHIISNCKTPHLSASSIAREVYFYLLPKEAEITTKSGNFRRYFNIQNNYKRLIRQEIGWSFIFSCKQSKLSEWLYVITAQYGPIPLPFVLVFLKRLVNRKKQ